jgi:hypothetical protein
VPSDDIRMTAVDFQGGWMRKYWSMKRESISVRCRSTTEWIARGSRGNFRNAFRSFLYLVPSDLDDELDVLYDEDSLVSAETGGPGVITSYEEAMRYLKLDENISIQVRAYEKEFFYLKCLKIGRKPQIVLRILVRLAKQRQFPEILTTPETLFELLQIRQCQPLLKKKRRKIN